MHIAVLASSAQVLERLYRVRRLVAAAAAARGRLGCRVPALCAV